MGSVPRGTRFIFAGASGAAVQVDAADVEASIARNVYYGEDSPAAHLFWSPVLEGDTAVVEIDMPAGAAAEDLHVAMPLVSHLVTSASRGFAAACGPSACDDEAGPADGNAVARIVFTEAGATYACNGMLVADRDPETMIPFFLTSRHCIATQSAASSAQPYWPHDGNACGAMAALDAGSQGATLLHADGSADLTLLRLQHAPPAGTAYAGWMVGTQRSAGSDGDPKPAALVQARFDPGQGAPSLRPVAASLGQCAAASGTSARFEAAYNAGLYQWLGGAPSTPTPTPAPTPTPVIYAPTTDYSDLWWNPNESGWGLSITQHSDNVLFGAWYLYDDSGRPTWIVMPGGAWSSPTTFTGDLYSASGPDPTGSFNPSLVSRTRVGTATLTFSDAQNGKLTYTVNGVAGSKTIQRQVFGTQGAALQGYGDLWWNPNESGWGVSITQHASTLFAVWYSYDASGRAVWYVMPGGTWNGLTYSGTLYRTSYSGGSYFGSAFNPNGVGRTAVGTLSFNFFTPDYGTMTYTINGVTGSKTITHQVF